MAGDACSPHEGTGRGESLPGGVARGSLEPRRAFLFKDGICTGNAIDALNALDVGTRSLGTNVDCAAALAPLVVLLGQQD